MSTTAPTPIAADLACMRCHYNLRTLSPDSLCPECATPVAESIAHHAQSAILLSRLLTPAVLFAAAAATGLVAILLETQAQYSLVFIDIDVAIAQLLFFTLESLAMISLVSILSPKRLTKVMARILIAVLIAGGLMNETYSLTHFDEESLAQHDLGQSLLFLATTTIFFVFMLDVLRRTKRHLLSRLTLLFFPLSLLFQAATTLQLARESAFYWDNSIRNTFRAALAAFSPSYDEAVLLLAISQLLLLIYSFFIALAAWQPHHATLRARS